MKSQADFDWEKTKQNNQNGRLKKPAFFRTANSQYFFAKISGIDPWVSRINCCKEQRCGST
jgi:hypothetical protein